MIDSQRSPISIALIVSTSAFLLSALSAVWVSYDRVEARSRFWLIAAGILMLLAVLAASHRWGDNALMLISLGCTGLAAALGIYWLLTYDWGTDGVGKFTFLQSIGLWIQLHRPNIAVPEDINPNVAGAGLVVLLPLGAGGMISAWRKRNKGRSLVAGLCILLALAVLALTASRGAWLGLAAGCGVALYLAGRSRLSQIPYLTLVTDILLVLFPVGMIGVFFLAVNEPEWIGWLGEGIGVGNASLSRATLWRQGLDLVGDYPFTGSGLQGSMLIHSSYMLLLHVGFITHMHNLFLEIAVQQGLPGLLAFVGIYALAMDNLRRTLSQNGRTSAFALGAVASLTAIAVHGMVDAGLFASRMLPLLFLALGFGLGVGMAGSRGADKSESALGWTLGVAIILGLLLLPQARAAFQANWGTVTQTRSELSIYAWPQWPIQDALRRSPAVDLTPAVRRYEAALVLNPINVAANRRLGQIELSLGQYDDAYKHLAVAYAYAPQQQATRQLLAEATAISGDTDRAAALLRTVSTAQSQWQIRIWWYNYIGKPEIAQRLQDVERLATGPAK